jgi:K+-sensing histidine kinase KdpD
MNAHTSARKHMQRFASRIAPEHEADVLLPYVTDLEFEVDRLRKQGQFVEDQAWAALKRTQSLCSETNFPAEFQASVDQIKSTLDGLARVLIDLHQHPGYHPAHDQVVPISVRPLVNQVFRWHQRLEGATDVTLRLELEIEYVDWFPARLRHIIDNLLANALRHGATDKGEARITIALRRSEKGYELRVADNGTGISPQGRAAMLNVVHRAAPARAMDVGVGLAVVKSLIEQSGGTLTIQSDERLGTCLLAVLPRYDIDDYLEKELGEFGRPDALASDKQSS